MPSGGLHMPYAGVEIGQNEAQIRQNLTKIHCFNRIFPDIRLKLTKHPKLELSQRVEHVSTPLEDPERRIFMKFQDFMLKFDQKRAK